MIPANITAGECCDHCGPLPSATTTTATKETKVTKKIRSTDAPKKSSSSSEEKNDELDNRSSEDDVQPHRCNLRRHKSKPKIQCKLQSVICLIGINIAIVSIDSRLIRLLTKTLIHLRCKYRIYILYRYNIESSFFSIGAQSNSRFVESSESREY